MREAKILLAASVVQGSFDSMAVEVDAEPKVLDTLPPGLNCVDVLSGVQVSSCFTHCPLLHSTVSRPFKVTGPSCVWIVVRALNVDDVPDAAGETCVVNPAVDEHQFMDCIIQLCALA
jgi:hypothetical protein